MTREKYEKFIEEVLKDNYNETPDWYGNDLVIEGREVGIHINATFDRVHFGNKNLKIELSDEERLKKETELAILEFYDDSTRI